MNLEMIDLNWILVILSSNLIANLLVKEDGLFSIFVVIRYVFGIRPNCFTFKEFYKATLMNESDEFELVNNSHLGKLVSCIYCTTGLVTLLTSVLYLFLGDNEIFVTILFIFSIVDLGYNLTHLLEKGG